MTTASEALLGPRVRLRALAPADAPRIAAMANDRRVARNLHVAFPHPYRLSDARGFIALAGGSGRDGGLRWWSNNLDSLRAQLKGRNQKGALKQQLRKLDPELKAQALLALDGNGARQLLGRWPLWRGLQLLAGQPLAPSLQGMAITLEQDQQRASLQAQLNLR